jgi:hypothetical protein
MPLDISTPQPERPTPDRDLPTEHVGTLLSRSAEHLAGRHLGAVPNCWRCRRERRTERATDE